MMLFLISLISLLPVFFLAIFSGGLAALPALVGAIVLSLGFTGLAVAQSVYFNKHWFRFQDVLVASPVSAFSYALGLSISTIIVSLPTLILSFGILLYYHPIGILPFLGVLGQSLLLWLALVFMGFAMGLSIKSTRRANSLPQILGFMLGFLPPVYYPLSMLPEFLRPVALLIPSTHAAQLSKYYFGMLPLSGLEIIIGWAYMIGFTVAMGLVAARVARWVDP